MKKLFILSLLFCSINSFSQIEELQNSNWYLYEMEVDDMIALFPETESEIDYQTNFTNNTFSTNGCNAIMGEFNNLNDNSFQLTDVAMTLLECQYEDYDFFDEFYFYIFSGNENEIFTYTIEPNPDFPNSKRLIITNPFGHKANYHNAILSNQEISTNKIQFSPNPVNDKLTIQNPDSKLLNTQITDSNGKLLFTQKINSDKTEINFSNYPKGIYFITFKSEGKIIKTQKIIKK
ncbi:T9SS type A sorting domain-containing protein [Moheibacter sediminis]|uniref:Por secretion system C-terminal sorting domain-containing protein n=1 Tax=Moheibacter sediminis TaxID=1434700 RepID=A0A1W2AUZ3_9FLAO|nr:T9SS type A sorting domain-containing protein [Moheibacter sediminis]SMC64434.1 Por secretion system C-terminal sorting domain-containing protein [Moheibacter sediminis]